MRAGLNGSLRPRVATGNDWRAIEAGTSYRVIPWQMGVAAKIMRALPNPLFDRLATGRGRKKRRGEA